MHPLTGDSRADPWHSREFERDDGHSRVGTKRDGTGSGSFTVALQAQILARQGRHDDCSGL